MAKILKEESSLSELGGKRILSGIGAIIIGILIMYFTQHGIVGFGILIVGLVFLKQGSAFWTGSKGEDLVTDLLQHMPDNWYVINDIVVGPSQIDHIVICPKGVYTIETKNYRGTIYGNANDKYWMQVFPNGSKYDFYNPVKQGNKHSLELGKYLEENNLKSWVNTIVVFPGDEVTLKVYSPKTKVLYLKELAAYFMEQKDTLNQKFCDDVVECIQKLVPKEEGKESVSHNNQ